MKKLSILLLFIPFISFGQNESKYPIGYQNVNDISQLEGHWNYNDDTIKIDTKKKTIQINDGMIMHLTTGEVKEYEQFYIFGRIGSPNGTPIFRSRVRLSPDKKMMHLDRVDGNQSNIYKKIL